MYNTEDRHSKIKFITANKIINECEYYKDFIMHASMVNSAEDYKSLLSRNGEYVRSVVLTHISRLSSKYLFKVHYENDINIC